MPRLRRRFAGPRVTVRPQVMSGPASPGQQVCTGSRARSTSSRSQTISWQGAPLRVFGAMSRTRLKSGNLSHRSRSPAGGSGSLRYERSLPISRRFFSLSSPIAAATRPTVPKRLASTGMSCPAGFSKSSAGPPACSTRSQISVISRRGDTGAAMRFNARRASSWARNSRRSAYFTALALGGHETRAEAIGEIEQQRVAPARRVGALERAEAERQRRRPLPAAHDQEGAAEGTAEGEHRQEAGDRLHHAEKADQSARHALPARGGQVGHRRRGPRAERRRDGEEDQRSDDQADPPAEAPGVARESDAQRGDGRDLQRLELHAAAMHERSAVQHEL